MADRRLRQAERLREVADAGLAAGAGRQDAQQAETGRIGQHPKGRRQPSPQDWRAALLVDLLDESHADILTRVDQTWQAIDRRRYKEAA
jgi:hypothetical protein